MITIGLLNSKGGVGKSTLAAALAVRAAQSGQVAVVDLDPQGSAADWYRLRGSPDNPRVYTGEGVVADAIEKLRLTSPARWVFFDGPPGSLITTAEAIDAADFVVVPSRASGLDLISSQDVVRLCQDAQREFVVAFNDLSRGDRKLLDNARETLIGLGVPVAETAISHRVAYINAMTTGRTGAETNKDAAAEIEALWAEVRTRATAAAKRKGARRV